MAHGLGHVSPFGIQLCAYTELVWGNGSYKLNQMETFDLQMNYHLKINECCTSCFTNATIQAGRIGRELEITSTRDREKFLAPSFSQPRLSNNFQLSSVYPSWIFQIF